MIRQFGSFQEADLEKAGFDRNERKYFRSRFDHKCKIVSTRAKAGAVAGYAPGATAKKEINLLDRLEDYLKNRAYWGP